MMTVVDHVKPWLMPSSTLAKTIQPQLGAQMMSNGTGSANSQPVTRPVCGRLDRRGFRRRSSSRLHRSEGDDERQRGRESGEMERAGRRSGKTVRSWPIIPPTSALTPTRSGTARGSPAVRVVWASRLLAPMVIRGRGRSRPTSPRTALQDRDVVAFVSNKDRRAGHRPFSVSAHNGDGADGSDPRRQGFRVRCGVRPVHARPRIRRVVVCRELFRASASGATRSITISGGWRRRHADMPSSSSPARFS